MQRPQDARLAAVPAKPPQQPPPPLGRATLRELRSHVRMPRHQLREPVFATQILVSRLEIVGCLKVSIAKMALSLQPRQRVVLARTVVQRPIAKEPARQHRTAAAPRSGSESQWRSSSDEGEPLLPSTPKHASATAPLPPDSGYDAQLDGFEFFRKT